MVYICGMYVSQNGIRYGLFLCHSVHQHKHHEQPTSKCTAPCSTAIVFKILVQTANKMIVAKTYLNILTSFFG